MTLFQDTGSDPRAARSVVADVLAWYGAVGDAVLGNTPGFALRKASIAVSLARSAAIPEADVNAIFFAGVLHAAGAIGNPAYRAGESLSERIIKMESWDVPAAGATLCAKIAALPLETADLVRWQSESWDGTGYPDQLRWHGIPKSAQLLHLADRVARVSDPEEALASVGLDSGRVFGPDTVREFTMWFHRSGGTVEAVAVPIEALNDAALEPGALLDDFADRIDAHIGMPGRWRSIEALATATAQTIGLDEPRRRTLGIACRLYGAGEIGRSDEDTFDPLARMGVEQRAHEAAAGAAFAMAFASLRESAAVVGTRGEWFDGTGKPDGRKRAAIPAESGILAAVIAHDKLDRKERLDTAAGVQFDPAVVRAVLGVKSRA
jgi:response regulator RpfG family c-di-GMP phosphodiesterase